MEEAKETIGYRDILRQKEYMKIIVAALINRLGDSLDALAFTWVVYEVTGSASWSALIYAVNLLPTIFVTPFAGAWVEKQPKKSIMVITDLARAICVTFVATAYLTGFLRPWMLIVSTMFISTVEAFRMPANTALTPMILDKKYYEYGMSLMSTLTNAVQLIGMALAAAVISVIGNAGALYADVATFVLSALIICTVRVRERRPEKKEAGAGEKGSYWADLASGFQYLKGEKILVLFLITAIIMNAIVTPLNSMEAPLASEILMSGVEVISVIGVTLTLGTMLGNYLYPMARKRMRGKVMMIGSCAYIGVYYLALVYGMPFYENRIFLYAYVAILSALLGVAVAFTGCLVNVEMVRQTDEAYLARVGSIYTAFQSAASPLVGFAISGMATALSTRTIFLGAGILGILACLPMPFIKILDTLDAPERG